MEHGRAAGLTLAAQHGALRVIELELNREALAQALRQGVALGGGIPHPGQLGGDRILEAVGLLVPGVSAIR